jgi:hypothetical protein
MESNNLQTKNILFTFLMIVLVFAAGLLLFTQTKRINTEFSPLSEGYLLSYENTGRLSYLIQAAIMQPDSKNLTKISDRLLDEGEYRLAGYAYIVTNDSQFHLKAAEAALLNLDYEVAQKQLAATPDSSEKEELILFLQVVSGENTGSLEQPKTNAGKLLTMVTLKTFSLYPLEGEMGKSISAINRDHPDKIDNLLSQADHLATMGHYHLALETLTEDPGECTKDFYLLKSDLYNKKEQYGVALKVIEEGMRCNPTDQALLSRAVEYSISLAEPTKAEYYKQRLNYLVNISD